MRRSGLIAAVLVLPLFGLARLAPAQQVQHVGIPHAPLDYSGFGKDDRWGLLRCFDRGFWKFAFKKCAGYPPSSLPWANDLDARSEATLLEWIRARRWGPSSGAVERQPVDAAIPRTEWPKLSVQSIEKPRDFSLSLIPARGSLLGKITVERGGVADRRYGVSGLGGAYEKEFYVVASGFIARDQREPDNITAVGPSRLISSWYILGVRIEGGQRRVVRVGNTGTIRWCGHPHREAKENGTSSAFLKCAVQPTYLAIVGNRALRGRLMAFPKMADDTSGGASSMSPQWIATVGARYANTMKSRTANSPSSSEDKQHLELLNQFLESYDPFTDPVWITCGVGCCIAET